MADLAEPDYRALFDAAPGAILALDPACTVLAANQAYLRATGARREELVGHNLYDAIAARSGEPDGATARLLRASFARVQAKKRVDSVDAQLDLPRPLGVAPDPARARERSWRMTQAPLLGEDGEVRMFIHRLEDVTERLLEERKQGALSDALKVSEERFRSLVEGVRDYAIVTLDTGGHVVSWNDGARRIKGYPAEEILGKHVSIFYPPEDIAAGRPERELREAARDGRYEDEGWRVRQDGSRFWANVIVTPIHDDRHDLVGFSKITRDFTERQRVLDELRASEERAVRMSEELRVQNRRAQEATRMKSEFLANMSHELRTPLNAIIGFADLLHENLIPFESPQHHEFLGDILKSGRHLLQLINDILDLSKVEAGRMEFRPERLKLERPIQEVVNVLRAGAEMKRLRVGVELDPAVSEVTLDAARFKQVLYNFLSNALKFTPEGGAVTVRVRPEGDAHFRLEVEDSGIGIAAEDLERLFVEFQQLDGGLNKQHGGTGLGLALTRRMVTAQDGSVGVSSEKGKGSVFHAVLPRHSTRLEEDEPPPQPGPREGGRGPVLVVDDEPANLRLMQAALQQLGLRAVCEMAGQGALEAVARERPAAVVLDLLMPGMNGFEFLERFRAVESNRAIPVLIWTAKELSGEERARLRASAQAVLTKGVNELGGVLAELRAHLPGREGKA